MKIVINACFGGFELSHKAFLRLRELGNVDALDEPDDGEYWDDGNGPRNIDSLSDFCYDIPRDNVHLIQVVEELGNEASGSCANLKIVNIPDNIEWEISEYDGSEHIAEKHRTWH